MSPSVVLLNLHGGVLLHSASLNTTRPQTLADYLNLLTMTAIIRSTSTVMIAIVTILFVAILVIRQHSSLAHHHQKPGKYLRAIPLSVLLLLSV
jgi:hypothetical protein